VSAYPLSGHFQRKRISRIPIHPAFHVRAVKDYRTLARKNAGTEYARARTYLERREREREREKVSREVARLRRVTERYINYMKAAKGRGRVLRQPNREQGIAK
jgi:hypothetical protein